MKSFQEARAIVHKEGFTSGLDYRDWKQRPSDIPPDPDKVYKDLGWIDWFDWLGTGVLPFNEARTIVRMMNIPSVEGYADWKQRPSDIPPDPDRAYKDHGWIDWSDWLGI